MSELTDLQLKTSGRKDFIDFSNPDDIALMGRQLLITEFDHSYGKPMPTVYYDNGLSDFDVILKGSREFEYGLIFYMASFLNAVVFGLYQSSGNVVRVGVWRHRLINFQTKEGQEVVVLKENRVTNMLSSGIFGVGIIGVVGSMVAGTLLKKVQNIHSSIKAGVIFDLNILDENDLPNRIRIHSLEKHKYQTALFLTASIPQDTKSTTVTLPTSSCYIATACYGDVDAVEVKLFRWYRDNYLAQHLLGRIFIKLYYQMSPILSKIFLEKSLITKLVKRLILDNLAPLIKRKANQ